MAKVPRLSRKFRDYLGITNFPRGRNGGDCADCIAALFLIQIRLRFGSNSIKLSGESNSAGALPYIKTLEFIRWLVSLSPPSLRHLPSPRNIVSVPIARLSRHVSIMKLGSKMEANGGNSRKIVTHLSARRREFNWAPSYLAELDTAITISELFPVEMRNLL